MKRATLLCIDESAFCTEELITAVLPFLTQDSDFKTSTNKSFNMNMNRKFVPNQVIYASSAGDWDSHHAKVYKEFAYRMIAGDNQYFVADMPCDIPLAPFIDGKPTKPYLTQQTIDNEFRTNPGKAMREYYNKFQSDGGQDQMIKWAMVRRNETFLFPVMSNETGDLFAIAFDPARTRDNSIVTVMRIRRDPETGYYGEIVYCINLMDWAKKKKMQMKSPDQIKELKRIILAFNGQGAMDYENIQSFLIDAGTGGAGISAYADNLLESWTDGNGFMHKGLIDPHHDLYKEEKRNYPGASTKLNLVEPKKWRTKMCDELIELMSQDFIKFPKEYSGNGFISYQKDDGDSADLVKKPLSMEEELVLRNIDAMKSEVTSIYKFENAEKTTKTYKLPKEKENKMHDDRFFTLILLAHCLYELRRNDKLGANKQQFNPEDFMMFNMR